MLERAHILEASRIATRSGMWYSSRATVLPLAKKIQCSDCVPRKGAVLFDLGFLVGMLSNNSPKKELPGFRAITYNHSHKLPGDRKPLR